MRPHTRTMTGMPSAHQITLLQGGQELFPVLQQAIDAARQEVRLETYIFEFDASGRAIADALARAADRGVHVYLAVDGVGTPHLPPSWVRRFDDSGVAWHVFQPLGRWGALIPSRWRRLHRKLCIVDGEIGFCGGINIMDDFHDPATGPLHEPRLDFAVRVTGPLVKGMTETAARFWWRMTVARDLRDRELPAAWRELQQRVRHGHGSTTRRCHRSG